MKKKICVGILIISVFCGIPNIVYAEKNIDDMTLEELKEAYIELESEYEELKEQLLDIPISEQKTGNYDTEYDSIMESIETMNENSKFASNVVISMWDYIGPEKVMTYLNAMLTAESQHDIEGMMTSYYIGKVFDVSSTKDEYDICVKYQEANTNIISLQEDIKKSIKSLKDFAGDEHEDGISALTEYYVTSSAYGEFAMNPSGSLLNYQSDCKDYENKIIELQKAAELAK